MLKTNSAITKSLVHTPSENLKQIILSDMKNNMLKEVPIFSCIFWIIFVINTGSEDPYLVDVLEVPEIIQKVLEYVRESKLAILE